ncbi:MAG: nucleotide-binding protein [Candidatus Poribacteria bacterium]|nr:nucleotide-binding protein [Candidatus Poribacteria bacterium]
MEEKTLPKLRESREEAEKKIQERIEKGQQLRDRQIDSRNEYSLALNAHGNWSRHNKNLLLQLFDGSLVAEEYARCCIFPPIGIVSSPNTEERVEFSRDLTRYRENVDRDINYLMGIQNQLELFDEPAPFTRNFGDKIFIVHGHNEAAKHKIARFVTDLDLTATILDEQPSKGQTIIDKFEEHAEEAGFAIVLLTADDVGAPKDKTDESKPRARQNVILELGYFLCGLGRDRVCILYEEGVELPSDIHGIIYVQMDDRGAWKMELAQEIASVGITIDMNKLLPNR